MHFHEYVCVCVCVWVQVFLDNSYVYSLYLSLQWNKKILRGWNIDLLYDDNLDKNQTHALQGRTQQLRM